jgi:hypothetical protein
MKLYFNVTLILILLLLSACKKFLVDVSPEYEGVWRSNPVLSSDGILYDEFIIIKGKTAEYGEFCTLDGLKCNASFKGEIKINHSKKTIKIGKWFKDKGSVGFTIETPPFINSSGVYECRLTSTTYFKQ